MNIRLTYRRIKMKKLAALVCTLCIGLMAVSCAAPQNSSAKFMANIANASTDTIVTGIAGIASESLK